MFSGHGVNQTQPTEKYIQEKEIVTETMTLSHQSTKKSIEEKEIVTETLKDINIDDMFIIKGYYFVH